MAKRLTLLCHAPVPRQGEQHFLEDEPADPAALQAAAALGPALGRHARLLAAPERRAQETAAALGPDAITAAALRECDYGTWRGRGLGEIAAADPAGTAAWLANPAAVPHGGESILDLLGRVGGWLGGDPGEGHTIAVTHAGVIRAAIVHALAAPPLAFWRIDVEPLGLADLRWNAGRWTLRALGRR